MAKYIYSEGNPSAKALLPEGGGGAEWKEVANISLTESVSSIDLFTVADDVHEINVQIEIPNVSASGTMRIVGTDDNAFAQDTSFGDTGRTKYCNYYFDVKSRIAQKVAVNGRSQNIVSPNYILATISNAGAFEKGKKVTMTFANGFPTGTKIVALIR